MRAREQANAVLRLIKTKGKQAPWRQTRPSERDEQGDNCFHCNPCSVRHHMILADDLMDSRDDLRNFYETPFNVLSSSLTDECVRENVWLRKSRSRTRFRASALHSGD